LLPAAVVAKVERYLFLRFLILQPRPKAGAFFRPNHRQSVRMRDNPIPPTLPDDLPEQLEGGLKANASSCSLVQV
jgi:hypothetical protein